MSHEINILWASHVVHHQSEEYNLSTALRQTSGGIFGFLFYLPLAIIGVDPIIILTVGSLNLVYQFWVHTKHIDRMPDWFEFVFVTPSNHRVHHAQNPIYLDRNHGGVFILWDRIFGTFQDELKQEPVVFGVTKPLASWNPIWANLEVYWGLIQDAWRTKNWKDKLGIWFNRTGWRPDDVAEAYPYPQFDPYKQVKFDVENTQAQKQYILLQHLTTLAVVILVLSYLPQLVALDVMLVGIVLIWGLFTQGWYQEQRRFATLLEMSRLGLWGALLAIGPIVIPYALAISVIWMTLSGLLLARASSGIEKPQLIEHQ